MSSREAFEKWWPSVGQTIGKVAAWEAWQAAQAQADLDIIYDDNGCPTEVRIAQAQAGEGDVTYRCVICNMSGTDDGLCDAHKYEHEGC
jgi:hypothetical protein